MSIFCPTKNLKPEKKYVGVSFAKKFKALNYKLTSKGHAIKELVLNNCYMVQYFDVFE